jgi:8-oxo-dGTP pyrophosphatase MutT (NUDIX family)
MNQEQPTASPDPKRQVTLDQRSAGGVAFRRGEAGIEIVLVAVGPQGRWQLPKGIIDAGETPETTALREVREEAGIETELIGPLDTIEYWYFGGRGAERVRYHKYVQLFLLKYRSGDVRNHDHEVDEARWVAIGEAKGMLTYRSERRVVAKAEAMIAAMESAT